MNVANQTRISSSIPGENRDAARPVLTLRRDPPAAMGLPRHRHFRAQLMYAPRGALRVFTEDGTWIVPAQQSVWIPPGVTHSVRTDGAAALRLV